MCAEWLLGIDENGLGPKLGPLVVTAVTVETDGAGAKLAAHSPRGRLADRLGDSKALVSHGNVALGEAWARCIARRMGLKAERPDALFSGISLDTAEELTRPCPAHVREQCWRLDGEVFEADDALVARIDRDLCRLDAQGVRVRSVETAVVCTRRLDDALADGRSRFDVDLHTMERLVLSAAGRAPSELIAICGKVGGYKSYGPAFGPLGGRLHAVVEESPERSEYRFPGLGRISFVRDADASHLVVGMASLVGKWVRELLMARIVRFYGGNGADISASGYHDPVTARFVARTADARKSLRVPDTCFQRAVSPHGRS
jgi:ribonuclease HII